MEDEEKVDQANTDETAPERPLNRAERRAQQHNKKSAAKSGAAGSARGTGFVSALTRGQSHSNTALPRTGHK